MDDTEQSPPRDKATMNSTQRLLVHIGLFGGIGFEMAAGIGGGLYVGYLVDRTWQTSPWGLLVGLALGSVASALMMWRIVKLYERWQKGM